MRTCMDSIAGITWERLERESSVTYPCEKEGDPGEPVVFVEQLPDGDRAAASSCRPISSPRPSGPDAQYPMVLITGRQLEHWHTGSMTRRASVLDHIEPEPVASVHPLDLEALGVKPGETLTIASRRGKISLYARADDGMPRGAVFVPFCYYEAAANMLTNPALDPFGKIPEFKYCAVRVTKGGPTPTQLSFGGGTLLNAVDAATPDAPRLSARLPRKAGAARTLISSDRPAPDTRAVATAAAPAASRRSACCR